MTHHDASKALESLATTLAGHEDDIVLLSAASIVMATSALVHLDAEPALAALAVEVEERMAVLLKQLRRVAGLEEN